MTVEVVVETTNLTLIAGQGQRVTVPANDRIEVRFPAAAEMAGTARFQIARSISGDTMPMLPQSLCRFTPRRPPRLLLLMAW